MPVKTPLPTSKVMDFPLEFALLSRAEIIAELIPKRAGPVIFKTLLLELIAFRLIPVICPARIAKLRITGKDN